MRHRAAIVRGRCRTATSFWPRSVMQFIHWPKGHCVALSRKAWSRRGCGGGSRATSASASDRSALQPQGLVAARRAPGLFFFQGSAFRRGGSEPCAPLVQAPWRARRRPDRRWRRGRRDRHRHRPLPGRVMRSMIPRGGSGQACLDRGGAVDRLRAALARRRRVPGHARSNQTASDPRLRNAASSLEQFRVR